MTAPRPPVLPVVQFRSRAGSIDLGWGHPHPAALPVDAWAEATRSALRRYGAAALTYGHAAGPGPLVEWLCERLGEVDAVPPEPGQVFVSAGASHALDLVAAVLCRPGDVVLVDSPTYHLALRVIADHRVDTVPAPADQDGIDPAATGDLIRAITRQGRRVAMLYLVPTFNNPTGRSLPAERRAALLAMAAGTGVTVVEDDTYRELAYPAPAPPSLFSAAEPGTVVRIGSFAKSVAPGLRLGWLTGARSMVGAVTERGYVDSGGGVNHASALAMTEFAAGGAYRRHVAAIRVRYRRQRDALVAAVREELPQAEFVVPGGGWFLWLRLPHPNAGTALLPYAEAAGVGYLPGRQFFVADTGHRHLRLSYSMCDPETLAEAVRRLAVAYRDAGFPARSTPLPG
ncbi:PLP-dependent aminotransferase family protein [Micromonospora sp. WMMD1102]|uniref:aminotransferase-like domain-containing protein n=1 Tax=Micromonospora sp. WMMD1102 TaxID=3016105 RepID=UPI0024156AFB|nr:PLP-dependent aminotransferase family protein [Micromonospora sp. WMMD1102]MDG4787422.1 PLP-dependent aminotransferase family protein [Micromonospora sp. WMMD1102]